jgi:hypothetical protein
MDLSDGESYDQPVKPTFARVLNCKLKVLGVALIFVLPLRSNAEFKPDIQIYAKCMKAIAGHTSDTGWASFAKGIVIPGRDGKGFYYFTADSRLANYVRFPLNQAKSDVSSYSYSAGGPPADDGLKFQLEDPGFREGPSHSVSSMWFQEFVRFKIDNQSGRVTVDKDWSSWNDHRVYGDRKIMSGTKFDLQALNASPIADDDVKSLIRSKLISSLSNIQGKVSEADAKECTKEIGTISDPEVFELVTRAFDVTNLRGPAPARQESDIPNSRVNQ